MEEDANIAVTSKFFSMEIRTVETLIDGAHQNDGIPRPVFTLSPRKVDQVSTLLTSFSPTLDESLIYYILKYRSEIGNFKPSIGSTDGTNIQFLVEDDTGAMEPSTDDDFIRRQQKYAR